MCNKEKQYPNSNIEKQGNKLIANVTCGKRCRSNKKRETSLEKYGVESPTQSKEVQDKMKATNLERYGSENVFASDYGKEKIKETNLERYGAENPMQNEEVKEKVKQTNLEKYGGVAPAQNKEVQEKMKRTTFEKFGVENAFASPEIKEKIKQTNLEKYGTEYASQSEEVKKKMAQTNLEKYGNENVFASDYGKEKIRETMLERHGVEHALQSEEFMDKFKQTSIERFGTEYPAQNEEIREKIKQAHFNKSAEEKEEIQNRIKATNLERYGVENPFSSLEIQEKIKQTILERYDVEFISQSPEIREKIEQTNLERYGVEYPFSLPEYQEKARQTLREKYGVNHISKLHITNVDDWDNFTDYLEENKLEFDCIDLAKYFSVSIPSIRTKAIKTSSQHLIKDFYTMSGPEAQFKEMLNEAVPGLYCIMHNRQQIKPLEIDFYFPDHNLGVEISPMYTHCYKYSEEINYGIADKQYHYDKFKACEEAGIELITVFDWHDLEKVIELVKNKVSPAKQVLYARKCDIRYSDSITKEHREFLNKYHVLGQINNKSNKYGKSFTLELTYNDEVVGLAVYYPYGEDTVELKRLAFKDDITIVGGASKLLKHVFDYVDIKQVLTFSDNNLGTGNVYKTIGFDLVEDVKGTLQFYNYEYSWLVRDTSLWMVGADRLLANFPGYTPVGIGPDKPGNREIVMSYGFEPMFDCGYRKWMYKK